MHILQHFANLRVCQLQILDLLVQITDLVAHQGDLLLDGVEHTGIYGHHGKVLVLVLLHWLVFLSYLFLQEEKVQLTIIVGLEQAD